jgi:hypothetical protein
MSTPIVDLHESIETIYSPFSGIAITQEDGVNEADPSLLFSNFDNNGGYVSQRLIDDLGDIDDASTISEEEIARITISGAIVFRHDCGWNGVVLYGFAPP